MILFLLLLVLVAVALAIYGTENTAAHPVTFWNWHWSGVPDWVPVVTAAAVVAALFLLYMIYSGLVHGVRLGSMRRRVSTREQAISEMRAENQRLREENARLRAQSRTVDRMPAGANPNMGNGTPAMTGNRPVSADRQPVGATTNRAATTPPYAPRPTFGERVRAFFSGRQPAGY